MQLGFYNRTFSKMNMSSLLLLNTKDRDLRPRLKPKRLSSQTVLAFKGSYNFTNVCYYYYYF